MYEYKEDLIKLKKLSLLYKLRYFDNYDPKTT